MIAYLMSIMVIAISAGLLLDLFAADQIRQTTISTFENPDGPFEQTFKIFCAFIFLALFIDSLGRKSYQEPISDIRLTEYTQKSKVPMQPDNTTTPQKLLPQVTSIALARKSWEQRLNKGPNKGSSKTAPSTAAEPATVQPGPARQ